MQTIMLPIHIKIGNVQLGLSCLLNLFYLLLMVMFVRGVIALIATHRFPKGSAIEVRDNNNIRAVKRMDKNNSVWWKAWGALFTGNPNERRSIEGIKFKATLGGALVDLRKSAPPWEIESRGESFEEIKSRNPKIKEFKLGWGERLDNLGRPGLSLHLRKNSSTR